MGVCASKAKKAGHQANGAHGNGAQAPGEETLLHRSSQELSLAHLTRHHRVHPFRKVSKFGLDGSFEVVKMLGRGGTGETYLCKDMRAGGELVAVKLQQRPIPKDTVDMTFNECLVQATACEGCVFCTTLRDVVLTPTHFALVLELEEGGTMAEQAANRVPLVGSRDLIYLEEEARFRFKQLMAGISYLHRRHIAHRDIKLDNTLLDGRDPPTVKLADFQFSYYWGPTGSGFRSTKHLGTPVYMAPELIQARGRSDGHSYDPVAADVWAAAVWLVATLVGAFPFDNGPGADTLTAEQQILSQELAGSWSRSRFVSPYLDKLSPEAKDLLSRMLEPNPERRISVSGVLRHPWMTKPLPPVLQAAWQRLEQEQAAAAERVQGLHLDKELVEKRNAALHEVVEAAAREGGSKQGRVPHQQTTDERLVRIVDYSSIPDGVRIDMRLRAVAAGALAGMPPTPPRPEL